MNCSAIVTKKHRETAGYRGNWVWNAKNDRESCVCMYIENVPSVPFIYLSIILLKYKYISKEQNWNRTGTKK